MGRNDAAFRKGITDRVYVIGGDLWGMHAARAGREPVFNAGQIRPVATSDNGWTRMNWGSA